MTEGTRRVFVHAADLHLDSPLRGLPEYAGAPVEPFRYASRRALVSLVDLCISERAGLLLLAGDLVDAGGRDAKTGLFLAQQLLRLGEEGVTVVWVRGNHDAASRHIPSLLLPGNVLELGRAEPETRVFEALGIAVHGQSYPERVVLEDLSARYPPPRAGLLNVGLLHTSAEGRAGHDPYAPCTRRRLRAHGYDYWALGHVHGREVLSAEPWVVFPGNLQGRSVRESGSKGATVVSDAGDGVLSVQHRSLEAVRFGARRVGVDGIRSLDDAAARVFDSFREVSAGPERAFVVRLVLRGAEGVGRLLSYAPARRTAALVDAATRGARFPISIEGIWGDVCGDAGGTFELGAHPASGLVF